MRDRDRGTGHGCGWNRIKSLSIQFIATFALSAAPAFADNSDPPRIDLPLANAPVLAGELPLPPQFTDEPANTTETAVQVLPTHHAPQESAALGMPDRAFDAGTHEGEAGVAKQGASLLDPRGSDLMQVFGALAVVLSLLFATRSILRRISGAAGGARPSGVVEILARYPVARGQQLILLKLARRILLVHQNGSAMTTLSEIVDENEVASLLARVEAGTAKKDAGTFKTIFSKFSREFDGEISKPLNSSDQGEVIDLTRKPSTLGNLFTRKGVQR